MKHLYLLMSWPEDMGMLWVKFLSFVSVFCSANFMIVHLFKDKHKVAGDISSLILLVCHSFLLIGIFDQYAKCKSLVFVEHDHRSRLKRGVFISWTKSDSTEDRSS